MKLVWDERKRRTNLDKHGLDFGALEDGFEWRRTLVVSTKPSHTGRGRTIFLGEMLDGFAVVIVASGLGSEALSIVSVRPASKKERQLYANHKV